MLACKNILDLVNQMSVRIFYGNSADFSIFISMFYIISARENNKMTEISQIRNNKARVYRLCFKAQAAAKVSCIFFAVTSQKAVSNSRPLCIQPKNAAYIQSDLEDTTDVEGKNTPRKIEENETDQSTFKMLVIITRIHLLEEMKQVVQCSRLPFLPQILLHISHTRYLTRTLKKIYI